MTSSTQLLTYLSSNKGSPANISLVRVLRHHGLSRSGGLDAQAIVLEFVGSFNYSLEVKIAVNPARILRRFKRLFRPAAGAVLGRETPLIAKETTRTGLQIIKSGEEVGLT